jgi:hypothetical protein
MRARITLVAVAFLVILGLGTIAIYSPGSAGPLGQPRSPALRPTGSPQQAETERNHQGAGNPAGYPIGYPVGGSVNIDAGALIAHSANPEITGTASNIPEFAIDIIEGRRIPPAQYAGPGTIPHQIWGGVIDCSRDCFSNGRWSTTVDYSTHTPVLHSGIYTLAVYAYSYLLTYRYLTVQ